MHNNPQQIETKVKQALISTLNLNSDTPINLSSTLREDLGLDSMSSLIFLMKLEDLITGFQIDANSLSHAAMTTVASIIEYVSQQLSTNYARVA